LPQGELPVDDFVAQKGEQGLRRVSLQVLQLRVRSVDRPLPLGMAVGVQRHAGERLGERAEEADRIAHARLEEGAAGAGSVAARLSTSSETAARASTAVARESPPQPST